MFPNYEHGRFSVIDDGTLVIESVMKEDAGEYVCKGLSIAGSAYAKARLDVRGTTAFRVSFIWSVQLFLKWYKNESKKGIKISFYWEAIIQQS